MIIRKCSQGHRIRIHRNNTPNSVREKTYPDGSTETLTYPSSRYNYFVEINGEVVKRSNNWNTIEDYYVNACKDFHENGNGKIIIGKHKLVNNVITKL
tara:strand:+ start:191 stop:484 length:294 start_codon:yes stop_codon:yes gene_type:complete